jgi:hypothetical protein
METAPRPSFDLHSLHCLAHCPDCGYLLEGLASPPRCPECAFNPEPGLIVLWGWNSDAPASAVFGLNLLRTGMHFMVLGFSCVGIALLFLLVASDERMPRLTILTIIVAVSLSGTIPILVRIFFHGDAAIHASLRPIQLRLSPSGYAIRTGFGRTCKKAWAKHMGIKLSRTRSGRLRICGDVFGAFSFMTGPLFNFETELGPEEGGELHWHLEQWVIPAQVTLASRERVWLPPSQELGDLR